MFSKLSRSLSRRVKALREAAFWHHDIWRLDAELLAPTDNCLIVLDSFAHADGPDRARALSWCGNDEIPIFASAGIRRFGRRVGFAGILVPGAELVTGPAMPAIVPPEHFSQCPQAKAESPGWNM